uniref:Protochlorophyllide reductase n=1 Tax=Trieres chinensis TaxID=1514140 RepID=A0A7S1ZGH2_TRICV
MNAPNRTAPRRGWLGCAIAAALCLSAFPSASCRRPVVAFSAAVKSDAASSTSTSDASSSPTAASLGLGKKSTALDVLKTLNNASRLAPYVASGGTAVITGGNSGIGVVSVSTMAAAGMKVVLCSRSVEAGEKVVRGLPEWYRSNVRVQKLDLADLTSVQEAAEEILETEGQIDVLLNNAGVMAIPRREATAQGFEVQFGTNHIGHHMLTRLLLPSVTRGGRIVTVASEAHRFGQLDFADLNYDDERRRRPYTPWGAYGQSKLANLLFASALDDKLREQGEAKTDGTKSVSLHPGVVGTNLWRYSAPPVVGDLISGLMADKTVEQGAATNVFACLAESSMLEGGEYLNDCVKAKPSEVGRDAGRKMQKKLWETTEELIREAGYSLPDEIV